VMTTHLGSTTVEELRMPKPARHSWLFREMAELAESLSRRTSLARTARLHAVAAHAYALTVDDFQHVLSTFPLVPEAERLKALDEFRR
jgi:hypothetical protein